MRASAISSLINQPNLEEVHVNGTGVTPSGVVAFRAKKSRGRVDYGPIEQGIPASQRQATKTLASRVGLAADVRTHRLLADRWFIR